MFKFKLFGWNFKPLVQMIVAFSILGMIIYPFAMLHSPWWVNILYGVMVVFTVSNFKHIDNFVSYEE